jgi:hypothetical protein
MTSTTSPGSERRDHDRGCAYILGENGTRSTCDLPRRCGSAYCSEHHALCHVGCGTREEEKRLSEVEALASAVGGRRGRGDAPTKRFLSRLEHATRNFSRP